MIEFVVVAHPEISPQCCVVCQSATGPLVDTIAERWGDRIYLCKLCVKRAARQLGFVKGEKADQIDHALEVVAAKDGEITGLAAEVKELRAKLGQETRKVAQTRVLLDDTLARERTRAHLASEMAGLASQLATVGESTVELVA